jgi:large subunit ribosomal protein L15
MFHLANLPKTISQGKKRLGRGNASGKGAKSGRGTTRHQKARNDIKISFEGGQNKLTKKFPLLRGKGRNNSRQLKPYIVSLAMLESLSNPKEITVQYLVDNNVIPNEALRSGVKLVANGQLTKKLQVHLPLSKSAREKIEKVGGTVTL